MLTKNHATLKQEVAAHIAADQVAQGKYWENRKGCFIGCLTHSNDPTTAVERFGLTLPILRIAEGIFESLPADEAKAFFAAFPDAVACDGKDLSRVHWAFLAEELSAMPKQPDDIQRTTDPIVNGLKLLASGLEWTKESIRSALMAAATDAALAAADAAFSDYDDLYSARRAADAADYAAGVAAAYSAYSARRRQRDTLLRLIKEAPILETAE